MECAAEKEAGAMAPKQAWRRGDRLMLQGKAAEAGVYYERAARDQPDVRLWLRLARCHQARCDHEAARSACRRALEVKPESMPARYFLALSDLDAGETERAIEGFSEVISRQEENFAAICLRALARYIGGARREALADWHDFFCANMDFLVRFVATLESGRMAEAREKENAETPQSQEEPGNPIGASGAAAKASRRRLMSECLIALRAKKFDQALLAARRLAALHPKDSDCQFARGYAALEAERYGEAEKALGMALRMDRREQVRRRLWLRRKANRGTVRKLHKEISFNPSAQALRAQALIRLDRCEEARSILKSVHPEGPESYHKYYLLGLCELAEGRQPEAMHWFQYAFEHYTVDTIEMFVPALREWAERRESIQTASTP